MKRNLSLILIFVAVAIAASLAMAKDNPMTGTWSCLAKGVHEGPDTPFTLYLEQAGEDVSGRVTSPLGDARISTGTFKHDTLELHIDTENGNYVLVAKFEKDTLSGTWTHDTGKGTWEGKPASSK